MNEFREQRSEYNRRKDEIERRLEGINGLTKSLKAADIKKDNLKVYITINTL